MIAVRIPYLEGGSDKVRPAVVVQCDGLNWRIQSTVVAVMTSNTKLASTEPTQLLIDPATPEGASSGIARVSVVKCENLFTIRQSAAAAKLGALSPSLLRKLDDCLRAALEL